MPSDSVVTPLPASATAAEIAAAPASGAAWPARFGAAARRSLRLHVPFLLLIALHVAVAAVVGPLFGLPMAFAPGLYNDIFLLVNLALALALLLGWVTFVLARVRPDSPTRHLWNELRSRHLTPERVAMALPVFLLFPLFASAFTYLKSAIPLLHPFAFDAEFAAWDEALHGGVAPWQWLQPLLGHPYVTAAVNSVYHLWFFVTYGVLAWQAVSLSRPRLRLQYLLTTLLLWAVAGNLLAVLLSSAGPVYFGRVTGLADPFAPLMAYLHDASATAPVMALQVQDMLWQAYVDRGAALGAGISAMPSLHVATAVSYMLLGFAIRRWLGIAFAVFAALIFVGSIHLGWHYALDGYAGALCAIVIWYAVGWLIDRVGRRFWDRLGTPGESLRGVSMRDIKEGAN